MPPVTVVYYADENGNSPVDAWLKKLPRKPQSKGIARIFRLGEKGHDLQRPEADYLENDIYELRWAWQRVNYRILYFFHKRSTAVLVHGFTKKGRIPSQELKVAIQRKRLFRKSPEQRTFKMEI
jgi:phage-related protein